MIEEDRTGQSVLKKENNEEKEKDEDDNVGIDVKKKDYKKKKDGGGVKDEYKGRKRIEKKRDDVEDDVNKTLIKWRGKQRSG